MYILPIAWRLNSDLIDGKKDVQNELESEIAGPTKDLIFQF